MKKIISLLLVITIISMTFTCYAEETITEIPAFKGMNDPDLLQYVEDSVFAELEGSLKSDNYIVEEVRGIYISEEYLEELAYNSQANVFFGFTLEEVEKMFEGTKYIFTLGENKETTVELFEAYEDTSFNQIVNNIAIGTGVILLCATVSIVATTVGAPATISIIFATAAEGATVFATKGFIIGGISAGIIKGIETGNFEESVKAALVAGSEGFKWGAISGAVVGGITSAIAVHGQIRTPRESELAALKEYGGEEQIAFLDGEPVQYATYNATRPDILRQVGDHLEAIEVKNYKLDNPLSLRNLKTELHRQVLARNINLPAGSTQRIVLDTKGRGYSVKFVESCISEIQEALSDIYPNIPIDYML